jgi:hypothetical protein
MGKSPMDQPTTRHICLSGCPQAGEMAHWVTADPFPASQAHLSRLRIVGTPSHGGPIEATNRTSIMWLIRGAFELQICYVTILPENRPT